MNISENFNYDAQITAEETAAVASSYKDLYPEYEGTLDGTPKQVKILRCFENHMTSKKDTPLKKILVVCLVQDEHPGYITVDGFINNRDPEYPAFFSELYCFSKFINGVDPEQGKLVDSFLKDGKPRTIIDYTALVGQEYTLSVARWKYGDYWRYQARFFQAKTGLSYTELRNKAQKPEDIRKTAARFARVWEANGGKEQAAMEAQQANAYNAWGSQYAAPQGSAPSVNQPISTDELPF